MLVAILIGVGGLIIGLTLGISLGRWSSSKAGVSRELRQIRATAVPSAEDRARNPYPHTTNPGEMNVGGF